MWNVLEQNMSIIYKTTKMSENSQKSITMGYVSTFYQTLIRHYTQLESKMCQISALSESEWIKWNFQFHFNLILILRLLPFSQRSVQFLVYSSTSSTGYKRHFHIGKMTMDLDHLIMKFLNRLLIEPMFFCFVFLRYGTMHNKTTSSDIPTQSPRQCPVCHPV